MTTDPSTTTMPLARIHGPDDVRIDEVPIPTVGPDDVAIDVAHCGICGSDLSYTRLGGIPGMASPFAIGHEFAGVVAEVGANVTHVRVGDRVVANPEAADNGIGSRGVKGAFAPRIVVEATTASDQAVIALPDEIDLEIGALIEPLAVGMHAVNQGAVTHDDKVAVIGAGPVGLSVGLAAQHRGCTDVVVADRSERRLATAEELGLTPHQVDDDLDLAAVLRARHGTVETDPLLGPLPATDVFVEATGAGPVFERLVETARRGARLVVVGVHFAPVQLNMISLLMRELHITAAQAYPTEFPEVIEMLRSGRVDVRPMVSHRFGLSRFHDALAQARRQDEAVKVLVDCQE